MPHQFRNHLLWGRGPWGREKSMSDDELADRSFVVTLAARLGIDLPEACIAGVIANEALLREHARLIGEAMLPDDAQAGG